MIMLFNSHAGNSKENGQEKLFDKAQPNPQHYMKLGFYCQAAHLSNKEQKGNRELKELVENLNTRVVSLPAATSSVLASCQLTCMLTTGLW